MPLSHHHIRTTVETYLAHHPHERTQLGGLVDALDRPTDIEEEVAGIEWRPVDR
ncbi:hypothetical protein G9272_05665 [Streptomyces asoensis]|uniref:Uncharacterized protein n=1 Tax=Streptomyces asoensis TaxID=249586 RepID=A0A6M4WEN6_9ACTN|nr:hypothetical protein [Streptomyces asoensis]QJS98903.1 hypothetical protein G9272_05665 [Streptomyces asoensis]